MCVLIIDVLLGLILCNVSSVLVVDMVVLFICVINWLSALLSCFELC